MIRKLLVLVLLTLLFALPVEAQKILFHEKATQTLSASSQIDCSWGKVGGGSYVTVPIVSSGGAVDLTSNPQILTSGHTAGDVCNVRGTSDTDTVQLDDGNGLLQSSGSIVFTSNRVVQYIFDGTNWMKGYDSAGEISVVERDTSTTPDTIKPVNDGEGYKTVSPDGTVSTHWYTENDGDTVIDNFTGKFTLPGNQAGNLYLSNDGDLISNAKPNVNVYGLRNDGTFQFTRNLIYDTVDSRWELEIDGSGVLLELGQEGINFFTKNIGLAGDGGLARIMSIRREGEVTVHGFLGANLDVGVAPGYPLHVEHDNTPVARLIRNSSLTNAVVAINQMAHFSTSSLADGFGVLNQAMFDSPDISTTVVSDWGAVRDGADNSASFIVRTSNAGTLAEKFRIKPDGALVATTSHFCADDKSGNLSIFHCDVPAPSTEFALLQTSSGNDTIINTKTNITFRKNNSNMWNMNATEFIPLGDNIRRIGNNTNRVKTIDIGTHIENDGLNINPPKSIVCTCSDTPTCAGDAAKATVTITPTGSYGEIDNNDPDGCDMTIADSGTAGTELNLVVIENAGGTVDFAHIAGQQHMAGGVTLSRDVEDWVYFTRRNDGGDGVWSMRGGQDN